MEISLHDVAGGALQEKVNQAFEQVMKNMQDPNTPWKNKRKINLTLTFIQNEDRTDCTCDISVDTKLAAVKPVSTKFCTEKDVSTGEIFAQEYGPGIRGQMSFKDVEQNTEDKTVEVDGNIVDTETGEVVKDSVIDLRAAKQA
ncbi:hypothetical protein [Butyribacter intestini]|jgi:hypothetical protein|uniref:Replication terminator protein n=1 Tax=Butyribacter intestini TaxID=1703332 RepID=A0AAW3JVK0_9FIRM|nr:hypothetical protein [Butyribacter intestini]KQC86073.1 hypothetical protein APZ18_02440 [Butyribacter intestini]RHU77178.1 hypothetical protein DXC30_02480 [Butyribacter intestini]